MEDFAHAMADFVRDHQAWAAPIVLVLAFGESLAFISLLIPAWGALVAASASGRFGSPAGSAPALATGSPTGSASGTRSRSRRCGRCRVIRRSCRAAKPS
jgi:hypothetical protein